MTLKLSDVMAAAAVKSSDAMAAFEMELSGLLKSNNPAVTEFPGRRCRRKFSEEASDSDSLQGTYDGSPSPPPPDLSKLPRRKRKRTDVEEIPDYAPRTSTIRPRYGIPALAPSTQEMHLPPPDNMVFDQLINEWRPKDIPPCKFFRTGNCRDGVHCTYWHNMKSESQRQDEARKSGIYRPMRRARRVRSYNSSLARLVQHSALQSDSLP